MKGVLREKRDPGDVREPKQGHLEIQLEMVTCKSRTETSREIKYTSTLTLDLCVHNCKKIQIPVDETTKSELFTMTALTEGAFGPPSCSMLLLILSNQSITWFYIYVTYFKMFTFVWNIRVASLHTLSSSIMTVFFFLSDIYCHPSNSTHYFTQS